MVLAEVKTILSSVLLLIEVLILMYNKIIINILIIKDLQKKIEAKINKIFN